MREIWTIGHWTCPEATFIDRLDTWSIDLLVDVRAHRGSRRSPQYKQEAMREWLERAGISYQYLEEPRRPSAEAGRRPDRQRRLAEHKLQELRRLHLATGL